MLEFEEIVQKIAEHANIGREEVLRQVEDKRIELSGLVSREGAAYIVGRELGVNLLKEGKRKLKIGNIVLGMRFVEVAARIVRIFEPREFMKDGKKGKVVNLILGDETGTIRLSLWNEETELVTSGEIKEDDVVKITGGYVKPDNRFGIELRVGKGRIEKADEDIPEVSGLRAGTQRAYSRKAISSLKDGESAEVRGCIVQVMKRNPFYEICPNCSKKVAKGEGEWRCGEHGEVKPAHRLVLSAILDDGEGNVRVVFFGDIAEQVAGMDVKALRKMAEEEADALVIYDNIDCLGKEFIVSGRVRKDEMTGNLELIANSISDTDPGKETEMLLKEFKV